MAIPDILPQVEFTPATAGNSQNFTVRERSNSGGTPSDSAYNQQLARTLRKTERDSSPIDKPSSASDDSKPSSKNAPVPALQPTSSQESDRSEDSQSRTRNTATDGQNVPVVKAKPSESPSSNTRETVDNQVDDQQVDAEESASEFPIEAVEGTPPAELQLIVPEIFGINLETVSFEVSSSTQTNSAEADVSNPTSISPAEVQIITPPVGITELLTTSETEGAVSANNDGGFPAEQTVESLIPGETPLAPAGLSELLDAVPISQNADANAGSETTPLNTSQIVEVTSVVESTSEELIVNSGQIPAGTESSQPLNLASGPNESFVVPQQAVAAVSAETQPSQLAKPTQNSNDPQENAPVELDEETTSPSLKTAFAVANSVEDSTASDFTATNEKPTNENTANPSGQAETANSSAQVIQIPQPNATPVIQNPGSVERSTEPSQFAENVGSIRSPAGAAVATSPSSSASANANQIGQMPVAVTAESAETQTQETKPSGVNISIQGPSTPTVTGSRSGTTISGGKGEVKFIDQLSNAVQMTQQHGRALRVRLTPPELGTMQIEVAVRDGVLTARLEVETTAAHRAVTENLSLLRDSLAQNGTVIERIDVQLTESRESETHAEHNDRQEEAARQQDSEQQRRNPSDSNSNDPDNTSARADSSENQPSGIDQLDIQV